MLAWRGQLALCLLASLTILCRIFPFSSLLAFRTVPGEADGQCLLTLFALELELVLWSWNLLALSRAEKTSMHLHDDGGQCLSFMISVGLSVLHLAP